MRTIPLITVSLLALAVLAAAGCNRQPTPTTGGEAKAPPAAATEAPRLDEHSYAEPDKVKTKDIALELNVDFDKKELSGSATYTLDWLDPKWGKLVLDTRDISIDKVVGERADGNWRDLTYVLAPTPDKILGTKLTIAAPERNKRIRITYHTSPNASGLQWLTPEMTEGKKTPFMFSQSQQIHARSWVPLQDTTMVRFTYTAHVTSPKDVMVLMSADNDPKAVRDGDYSFTMPQAIPSYLLAIAAGDLVFKPTGPRSGVWAEPAMAPKAANEFSDTEKMMETAEKLYGPYRWGRYDILVLPPSFPYGGMENPRLTFATPTAITGDKSLVSLIAHELSHSWSGNLVTFARARDAWLNEGFTTYVEMRIVEDLYGKERADMEKIVARNELKKEFTDANRDLQPLAVKEGVLKDPDDNLTGTVYTKGAWFAEFLENRFGREAFDAFLRGYFDHFAFQSITTEQFADYAKANLLDKYPGKVTQAEFDAWLHEPGIPATAPQVTSARFDAVDAVRKAYLDAGTLPTAATTSKWTTYEYVHFIEGLPEVMKPEQLAQIDGVFHFTGTPNGEIAQRWYPLAVRSGYTQANPAIAEFLTRIGRRKLIMPTYSALVKTPQGLQMAEQVFAKAKPGYHPITSGSVAQVIADAKSGKTQ
ncbi:M1 family metallopeptidase [Cognatilysobacter lacus]|uniref:Aminopeptidase N n=1 Tax=Cognatilysobacter lacus TaxID=1643323 RepID=A0A5D8Z533_9GAMM|nr:M1 family metallopeptidase [Lysobacter lacus]TZF89787.1 M1 family metallopeptidase [Lysobacter lacus]